MNRNAAFLAARRRNAQLKYGTEFMRLARSLLPSIEMGNLLAPVESLQFERELFEFLKRGVESGAIRRSGPYSAQAVAACWQEFLEGLAVDAVVCLLSNHRDFIFAMPVAEAEHLNMVEAVTLDGDTVYVTTRDQGKGFAVDRYRGTEEDDWQYEVDSWG